MVLDFEQHVYLDVYNEGERCLAGLINDGMSSGAFSFLLPAFYLVCQLLLIFDFVLRLYLKQDPFVTTLRW